MSEVLFTGAVLAGGASRRMGTPKALIRIGGGYLIERPLGALAQAGASAITVVGDPDDRLAALGFDPVPDVMAGAGPLAGLVAALRWSSEDAVAVLSCDLPFAAPGIVRTLVRSLDRSSADAVIPEVDGHLQPLFAAYRVRSADRLQAELDSGVRSVLAALAAIEIELYHAPDPDPFKDLDTPEDLRAAEESLP